MAQCGIMRIEKRGRGAVYGLQIEANRTAEDHAAGRDFDRSDVDWERTRDNVHLVKTDNWNKEITRQIHAAGLKERKNSTVLLDGLYTASPQWFAEHTPQEAEQYFRDCLEFHVREYCGGDSSRVINAVIHLDEKTPHMQVASVPIIEDEKGYHLSAKIICGGRGDFRLHQNHFFEQVAQSRGLERGEVRDDAAMKAHTTKREWQIATQDERLQEAQEQARRQEQAIEHNSGVIAQQRRQYNDAKQTIERARDAEPLVRALDAAPDSRQIAQGARKSLFGKSMKISPDDLEKLTQRASMGEGLELTIAETAERERKSRQRMQRSAADRKAAEDAQKAAEDAQRVAERIASGEEYKYQAERVNGLIDRYNELVPQYHNLRDDVTELAQQKADLTADTDRLRNERYMRKFCRMYQQDFDDFVRREKSREQGLER